MAKLKNKNKKKFSTENIHNEFKSLFELNPDERFIKVSVKEEMRAIKDLHPDSPEFKKRMNAENFQYFMELGVIYSQELMAAQQFLQSELQKKEFLNEYFKELDRLQEFFHKLGVRDNSQHQILQPVQLERLQRFEMRIEAGIKLIDKEILFWEGIQNNIESEITALTQERQQLNNQSSTILDDYANAIRKEDFQALTISLTLSEEEKESLGVRVWFGEVELNENSFRKIIQDFSEKVKHGRVSYVDQADFMQAEVRQHLHDKIKQSSTGFLASEQQARFVERNMNSESAKMAIYSASRQVDKYIAQQETKHGDPLKLNAVKAGEVDAKITEMVVQQEKVSEILSELREEGKVLNEARNRLHEACQNQAASFDLSSEVQKGQEVLGGLNDRKHYLERAQLTFGEKEASTESLSIRPRSF